MKLDKIKKYKLIKLKLIQNKLYKKNNNSLTKIEDVIIRLKKSTHVIYKYHINNKSIMFVGTPIKINKKLNDLLKNTNHNTIPENIWLNGIITNQNLSFRYLYKNRKTFNKIKKSDLIVILNSYNNTFALNEGYLKKKTIISLNLNISDNKSSYKIPGNFQISNKLRANFFYSILYAIIKKKLNLNLKIKNFIKQIKR